MPHVTPLHAADPRRVGRYRLAGRIAGMPASGQVYLATTISGSEVTITLLGDEEAADGAARDRFAAEAEAARRVAPFCAASILDAGVDGGHAFLVSEYVAGPSLLELIRAEGSRHGAELAALAIGAATGLAAIHQAGLVHGDFGPEHLVLSTAGPRVVAFGITPPYGAATPAADILAWAQTMVFAAAGSPPGSPEDLQVLPQPLRRLAAKCLSADPAARPAARSVVLELLGEDEPPAGVLAEGSRRAVLPSADSAPAPSVTPSATQQALPDGAGSRAGLRRASTIFWAICVLVLALLVVALVHRIQHAGAQTGALTPESADGTASFPVARSGAQSVSPSLSASASSPASSSAASSSAASSSAASSSAASSSPASSSAASSSAAQTIPPTLAGSWSGHVRQSNPADVFGVRIDLGSGSRSGTISYAGATFRCSGDLSLVSSAPGTVTMDQGIVTGQTTCANGVVTLRQRASGKLSFRFQGHAGPVARGTLARV